MREKERAMMMMSSQCLAPNWNLEQERRQEQVQDEQEEAAKSIKSSHVLNHPPSASHLLPMSNYDVAELTWENGQIAMHGLSGLLPSAQTKPIWNWAGDTLESLVHQATHQYQQPNSKAQDHAPAPTSICSTVASSGGKGGENSGQPQTLPILTRKRTRSESDNCEKNITSCTNNILEECDPSVCGSASATFCRDNDTTMMTWASLESGQSLKNKTFHEDSACHGASENLDNQDEDRDSKVEIGPSNSTKRNRIAAIHNQSERRRRDRINQKMKALQRLVPNASKNDKASMLDEVIVYLKQLQAQIQLMSMRNMPQMVMPLALQQQQQQQQQLQMSMLGRMNVGLGPLGLTMGMLNINPMAARTGPLPVAAPPAAAPSFVAPAFMMPSLIQAHALASLPQKPDPSPSSTNSSVPLPDPYSTILAQSINMDILNNMAALYRQQISQNNQAMSSQSQQRLGQ